MKEIWKDVVGFEGLYKVSNLGNVKSVDRYFCGKLNSKRFQKGKIMTAQKNRKGYFAVILHKNGIAHHFLIHRLVAISFIENRLNKEQVNHIDRNKLNNSAENLEWVTRQENVEHALSKCYKLVNPEGYVVEIFNLSKFCRDYSLTRGNIQKVLDGKRNQHKNWRRINGKGKT